VTHACEIRLMIHSISNLHYETVIWNQWTEFLVLPTQYFRANKKVLTNLIVDVKNSLLNLLIDLFCCVYESFLHICSCLGWCLHKDEAMFTSKCFTFILLYFPPWFQITAKDKTLLWLIIQSKKIRKVKIFNMYKNINAYLIAVTSSRPSSEAKSHSASQETPCFLWNPKVHYHVHKILSLDHILRKTNPVHTFPNYFFRIHYNIILPSMLSSTKWSLPFRRIQSTPFQTTSLGSIIISIYA